MSGLFALTRRLLLQTSYNYNMEWCIHCININTHSDQPLYNWLIQYETRIALHKKWPAGIHCTIMSAAIGWTALCYCYMHGTSTCIILRSNCFQCLLGAVIHKLFLPQFIAHYNGCELAGQVGKHPNNNDKELTRQVNLAHFWHAMV